MESTEEDRIRLRRRFVQRRHRQPAAVDPDRQPFSPARRTARDAAGVRRIKNISLEFFHGIFPRVDAGPQLLQESFQIHPFKGEDLLVFSLPVEKPLLSVAALAAPPGEDQGRERWRRSVLPAKAWLGNTAKERWSARISPIREIPLPHGRGPGGFFRRSAFQQLWKGHRHQHRAGSGRRSAGRPARSSTARPRWSTGPRSSTGWPNPSRLRFVDATSLSAGHRDLPPGHAGGHHPKLAGSGRLMRRAAGKQAAKASASISKNALFPLHLPHYQRGLALYKLAKKGNPIESEGRTLDSGPFSPKRSSSGSNRSG